MQAKWCPRHTLRPASGPIPQSSSRRFCPEHADNHEHGVTRDAYHATDIETKYADRCRYASFTRARCHAMAGKQGERLTASMVHCVEVTTCSSKNLQTIVLIATPYQRLLLRAKGSLSKDEENWGSMRNHVLAMCAGKARRVVPTLVCITYCSVSCRVCCLFP